MSEKFLKRGWKFETFHGIAFHFVSVMKNKKLRLFQSFGQELSNFTTKNFLDTHNYIFCQGTTFEERFMTCGENPPGNCHL